MTCKVEHRKQKEFQFGCPKNTHLTFSQAHKVGNNCINANFVFPYIPIYMTCKVEHRKQKEFQFGCPENTHSTFSQAHKVGNNCINANFVFPYICSFLHYLHHTMLTNMKLDINWYGSVFQGNSIGLVHF